jgi:cyclase
MNRSTLIAIAAVMAATPLVSGQQSVTTISLEPPQPPLVVDGIEVLKVQGQVYVLAGDGPNVAVHIGDEGVLVVDSGPPAQTKSVLAAIRQLTTKPIRNLINTSGDVDRVAGNELIVRSGGVRLLTGQVGGANPGGQNVGVATVAHENAFNRMIQPPPAGAGLTGDALPTSTFFTPKKDLFFNGEPVTLFHQAAAHTSGDLFVHFRKSDVVVTGDIFIPHGYPRVDTARGGTVKGVIDALNALLEITVPERNMMGGTRVIPGRGRISNEAEVVDYRDMVTIIRDRVDAMVKKGMTLQQVRAAQPSLEYDGYYGATTGPWTNDMFIEAVYRTLGGK